MPKKKEKVWDWRDWMLELEYDLVSARRASPNDLHVGLALCHFRVAFREVHDEVRRLNRKIARKE
jgi:hypothetical protein